MRAVSAAASCAAGATATVAGSFAETATLAPAHTSSHAPMNNAVELCIFSPFPNVLAARCIETVA